MLFWKAKQAGLVCKSYAFDKQKVTFWNEKESHLQQIL
jgi:hypothetical protein